jgi:predicted component of type VI protein secretion system
MSNSKRDDGPTRQTLLPDSGSPDDKPTGHIQDLGAIAELRAALGASTQGKHTLPLYPMPDQIVVGRGTACDWQIDDASLSRKHAQFRWNGRELTVEDLGSANGTRVGGRPARTATPVPPGESVQLGTVIVTFELKGKAASGKPKADDVATRLVQQPDNRPEDIISDPGLPALAPKPTVVRTPKTHAPVFRPPKDAAGPDEETRAWDPRAVLVHAPEKAFDGELLEQIKKAWREKRRMFVLAGAAAWMAILLMIWAAFENKPAEEDPFAALPKKPAPRKPKVEQLPIPEAAQAPPADEERDDVLSQAVNAYEQGRQTEALALFKRLAADPRDAGARFMVELLSPKKGATP